MGLGVFDYSKTKFVPEEFFGKMTKGRVKNRDVLLYNTLDYPAYGLAVEKVKVAFRMAYSIFDKIGVVMKDPRVVPSVVGNHNHRSRSTALSWGRERRDPRTP